MSEILCEICFRFTTRTQGTKQVTTMSLQNEFFFFLSFLATVSGVSGGEFCYDAEKGDSRWCTYGCCGYHDAECCDGKVKLTVGLAVVGVVVVSTIIAFVSVRRRAAVGTVIHTNPGPGVTIACRPMMYQPGYQPAPCTPQPGTYPPQAYPMGTQAPPAHAYRAPGANPPAGVPTPPPYAQADGGQVNAGYDNKY